LEVITAKEHALALAPRLIEKVDEASEEEDPSEGGA
jgi:hypothetical protein